MEQSDKLTFGGLSRSIVSTAVGVAALYVLNVARGPTTWILAAVGLAAVLSGAVNLLHRRLGRRGPSIAIVYVGLAVGVAVVLGVIVPAVVTDANRLAANVSRYAQALIDDLHSHDELTRLDRTYGLTGKLRDAQRSLPGQIRAEASAVARFQATPLGLLTPLVLIPVLTTVMLSEGRGLLRRAAALMPPDDAAMIDRLVDRTAILIGTYFVGTFVRAAGGGVLAYGVLLLLGVPYAALLAFGVFALTLVPHVGAIVATVLIALVTLFVHFPLSTVVWLLIAIVAVRVDKWHVVWTTDISLLVVLLGLVYGISLFGIVGLVVVVPIIATIQLGIHEWVYTRRERSPATSPPPLP